MFLTEKHLSRRTLLKGAGASLALPLLDAMIPAATPLSQTAAARKLRAGFFYLPHGMIMNSWTPSGSGANFKLNTIMRSLEPYKKYVTSVGNLKNDAATGSVHTANPGLWLSATSVSSPGFETVDQVIADQFRQFTPVPSLEVSSETTVQQRAVTVRPLPSFRSATRTLRSRWNSIRARFSLSFSATARAGHSIRRPPRRL